MNALIKRIDKKYFFGFDYYQQGSIYFPYSGTEKTFIDTVYFRENIDKEALKNMKKKINSNIFIHKPSKKSAICLKKGLFLLL